MPQFATMSEAIGHSWYVNSFDVSSELFTSTFISNLCIGTNYSDANFFVLGGDSLAATRVVRGLHALHHGIMDSRNLGGSTGMLDGPFAAKYLLKSETLGAYLVFLVSKAAFQTSDDPITAIDGDEIVMNTTSDSNANDIVLDPLYESLLVSITLGYAQVAYSLLDLGVDPNMRVGQGRLGKISDRVQQRILFKSTPLHLACLRGNPHLVKKLLEKGKSVCNFR